MYGKRDVYKRQVLFAMDIGERIIVHGLFEVNGVQHLNPVRFINDPVSYTHLHQKSDKEHSLVAALQVLQQLFRFAAVGSKVARNDVLSLIHI